MCVRDNKIVIVHLLKKNIGVFFSNKKDVYFDTIKGIKINRVLMVDLELGNLAASIYR